MSLDDVLHICRERQIELWATDGKLHFRAPQGALTQPWRSVFAPSGQRCWRISRPNNGAHSRSRRCNPSP